MNEAHEALVQDDEHRHRCEVRQVLRWRAERGAEWVREWLDGVLKHRGQHAFERLRDDCVEQWNRGHRGERDRWMNA